MSPPSLITVPRQQLDGLLQAIRAEGYVVLGPVVRDGAIVNERVERASDLPAGWTDVQAPGRYRLERRADEALFGYAVGPTSWKRELHPPDIRLWSASRTTTGFEVDGGPPPPERKALLGVRACELAAIAVQDRVLLEGSMPDPIYRARREATLIVAVQCGTASAACFCTSMGTGPGVSRGFDLSLTELLEPTHRFLVEVGSPRGAAVVARLGTSAPAPEADQVAAAAVVERTAASITRRLDAPSLVPAALRAAYEHPRWDDVAQRCLTCANCTMVCPTCFCTQVTDTTDLTGDHAERWRRWDSCFTLDFSHVHGGSVRSSARSRYRQWLTHKLSTWHEQFGSSGCVGCGRCITWCPVGIDLTEEVRALMAPVPTTGGA